MWEGGMLSVLCRDNFVSRAYFDLLDISRSG